MEYSKGMPMTRPRRSSRPETSEWRREATVTAWPLVFIVYASVVGRDVGVTAMGESMWVTCSWPVR